MSNSKRELKARKPKQERSKFLVDTIVEAATRVFNSLDYLRGTTNRVAEKAGVSIGSLYQYFPNKDSIISAVIDKRVNQQLDKLNDLIATSRINTLDEFIDLVVGEIAKQSLNNKKLVGLLYEKGPLLGMTPTVVKGRQKARELIYEFCKGKVEINDDELKLKIFVLINAVLGVLAAVAANPQEPIDEEPLILHLTQLSKRLLCA